ncbi:8c7b6b21-b774-4eeb-b51f-460c4ffc0b03 [Sclerotinia trifoliorum]|uniref:8c7b6b21-b774-4eeb-b51f-460c4ffc0b03 n=1 Tax=Sclerotinia trifoliorum TaxID=28548 RepID=A0A8H2W2Y8_9HELO|nr:8c7b6b21-b774-4eeb-b51f-460c4ffc0b03 [Sclerotinia trifoliorum]
MFFSNKNSTSSHKFHFFHMFKSCSSMPFWGSWSFACCFLLHFASAKTHQSLNEKFGGALTDSGDYLYGSNKWGDDGSGSQNMTVLLADTNGASFNATWMWEKNIEYVHAYPNVGFESIQLPTQIINIATFHLSGSWSVFPEGQESATDMTTALNAVACKADIALDIFLDRNNVSSSNASAATHEIMIWQSVWGGVWPIGYYEPSTNAPEYTLSGVTYQLFSGFNQQGQKQAVFSWVPKIYQESIDAEIFELVQELVRLGNVTADMYIGLVQFGSETVHAAQPVELQMKDIQMSIGVSSSKTAAPSATSTSKGAADRFAAQITNFAVPAALGLGAMLVV